MVPGLHFAFPAPIDETILVSTKFRQEEIDTFYFKVSEQNRETDLDRMGGGLLQPGVDGSMLTGDRNIIHARWIVQYRVSDPVSFVKHVYDEGGNDERERAIVRAILENSLVAAVGHWDVEKVIRGPLLEEQILEEARANMQQRLDALKTGLEVNWIKYVDHAPTPPLQVRPAFLKVLRAESTKLREIEWARQKANELLIGAAGENYGVLTDKLEGLEQARGKVSPEELRKMEEELGLLFGTHAGGEAIDRINRALSFATQVQQEIKADWDQFSRLLPEYKKNPMLVMRQQYWNVIPEVLSKAKKWYVTRGAQLIIDMVPPSAWAREEAKRKYGRSGESPGK